MIGPQVLIVARPELELADLYVVRRNGLGDREAFTVDHHWQRVAPGCEAHRLARLTCWAGAVSIFELDRALMPVRADLERNAL